MLRLLLFGLLGCRAPTAANLAPASGVAAVPADLVEFRREAEGSLLLEFAEHRVHQVRSASRQGAADRLVLSWCGLPLMDVLLGPAGVLSVDVPGLSFEPLVEGSGLVSFELGAGGGGEEPLVLVHSGVTGSDGRVRVLRGFAGELLLDAIERAAGRATSACLLGDLDGDGLDDLGLLGEGALDGPGQPGGEARAGWLVALSLATGEPLWTVASGPTERASFTSATWLEDRDGDGVADLVVAETRGTPEGLESALALRSGADGELLGRWQVLPAGAATLTRIGDLDGDGVSEVLLRGPRAADYAPHDRVFDLVRGAFVEAALDLQPGPQRLVFVPGAPTREPALLCARGTAPGGQELSLHRPGFSASLSFPGRPAAPHGSQVLGAGDFDGDGRLDLIERVRRAEHFRFGDRLRISFGATESRDGD